jgi:hypothetical protein
LGVVRKLFFFQPLVLGAHVAIDRTHHANINIACANPVPLNPIFLRGLNRTPAKIISVVRLEWTRQRNTDPAPATALGSLLGERGALVIAPAQ